MSDGLGWLDPKTPRKVGGNKHILWARVVLPLAAIIILILSAVWAQLGPNVDVKQMDTKDVQNTLETARFSSVDKDGQPFVIEADKVVQQDPSSMAATLAAPKGEVSLKDGGKMSLKAQNGLYQHTEQKLHLNGQVVLQRDADLTMTTDSLDVDLGQNTARGDKPVQAVTTQGDHLNAENGVEMDNAGNKIIFKGPATLTLAPKSQKLGE